MRGCRGGLRSAWHLWLVGRQVRSAVGCSTLMTFSTVGYGDIYPKTAVEELIACAMMIFGILLFGFIIGTSRCPSSSTPPLLPPPPLNLHAYGKTFTSRQGLFNQTSGQLCLGVRHGPWLTAEISELLTGCLAPPHPLISSLGAVLPAKPFWTSHAQSSDFTIDLIIGGSYP